jgi:curved DNA-binding protein CbpA
MTSPFADLGLPASSGLTDDQIRAAWRRIAAATHPDRADGGDPARFAAAAAAYSLLRTGSGRGEALAELRERPAARGRSQRVPFRRLPSVPGTLAHRLGPAALVAVIAGCATAAAVLAVGWQPASYALAAGGLTWVLRTGHRSS